MKKLTIHAVVSTAVLTMLIACGGGGGGAAPASTPAAVASTQAYAGNWVEQCDIDSFVNSVVSAPGVTPVTTKAVYHIFSLKNIVAVSSSKFTGQVEAQFFDNATCIGAAKGKQTRDYSFTVDGQAVIGGKTVDKVTATQAAIGGLSSGTTITINGVVYPGNYFTTVNLNKDIFLIEGTKWSFGVVTAIDQYPTELVTAAFFTKQ